MASTFGGNEYKFFGGVYLIPLPPSLSFDGLLFGESSSRSAV